LAVENSVLKASRTFWFTSPSEANEDNVITAIARVIIIFFIFLVFVGSAALPGRLREGDAVIYIYFVSDQCDATKVSLVTAFPKAIVTNGRLC
jgi:hypothetical protein